MAPADLDPAFAALLELAAARAWRDISLRDIAAEAGLPFADLYQRATSKAALLAQLSDAFDAAALATQPGEAGDPHDALFDAMMARIEAMEPHRAALVAIAADSARRWDGAALVAHLPRTARALLEAAGLSATPPRVVAMAAVWLRVARVWRGDEGALNRTMAEIDKRLKAMRAGLARVGAGF